MKRWKKRTLILSAAVLGLLLIVMAVAPLFALPQFWGRRYEQRQADPADFGVEAAELTLMTDDGLALASWFVQADGGAGAKGTIIILSGLQSPSVTAFFGYAKLFAEHGFNSLLVEMRARGLSEGTEIGFGMTEWRDVKAAADYLEGMGLPVVVMGTSMGAGTAIVAAAEGGDNRRGDRGFPAVRRAGYIRRAHGYDRRSAFPGRAGNAVHYPVPRAALWI